jgi:hypothetical protein
MPHCDPRVATMDPATTYFARDKCEVGRHAAVVAGKDIQPAETAQQDHRSRPRPDSLDSTE